MKQQIDWLEALKHHATDSGRVKLTAARVEQAAISMRENNDLEWMQAAISEAEQKLLGQLLAKSCDNFLWENGE